jgi:hypothetical protein
VAQNIPKSARRQSRDIKRAEQPNAEVTAAKRVTRTADSRGDALAAGKAPGRQPKKMNARQTTKAKPPPQPKCSDAAKAQYDQALKLAREADKCGGPLPVSLLRQAAQADYPPAVYALANWHLHGKGVKKDFKKAALLLTRAANQAFAPAQYDLAVSYELGKGVRKSPKKAWFFYLQAAMSTKRSRAVFLPRHRHEERPDGGR